MHGGMKYEPETKIPPSICPYPRWHLSSLCDFFVVVVYYSAKFLTALCFMTKLQDDAVKHIPGSFLASSISTWINIVMYKRSRECQAA